MTTATKMDAVGNVLRSEYQPDVVEVAGRKLKMEYIGMASVFLTIWLVNFDGLPQFWHSCVATLASFFLFLGLKKKTRDHLVTSFLMFAAAALAEPAVVVSLWVLPLALFGMCAWAMEGYLEKRRNRIYTFPAVLGVFAWTSWLWPVALAFSASYLLQPRPEHPGLRRKLALVMVPAAAIAAAVALVRFPWGDSRPWGRSIPDRWELSLFAALAVPTALALTFYWNQLAVPHKIHGPLFLALGPWDDRLMALFGMSAAVVLAATVFRQSVDSLRWRGAFKHAEWYYFWVLAAFTLFLLKTR